jgi:hypothetical protein
MTDASDAPRPEGQATSQEGDAERQRERANRLEELLGRHVAAERHYKAELDARDAALASANEKIESLNWNLELAKECEDRDRVALASKDAEIEDWRGRLATQCGVTLAKDIELDARDAALASTRQEHEQEIKEWLAVNKMLRGDLLEARAALASANETIAILREQLVNAEIDALTTSQPDAVAQPKTRMQLRESKDRTELTELIAKARAAYEAMSPEEKEAHDKTQRESWVRGEMELERLDREEGEG